jgi:Ser-tRNA(Ala) deacylase AlaX
MFAAPGLGPWIERQTGWSIKKFVRTARRYRTMQIRAGQQLLTAADPLPENLRDALAKTTSPDSAH